MLVVWLVVIRRCFDVWLCVGGYYLVALSGLLLCFRCFVVYLVWVWALLLWLVTAGWWVGGASCWLSCEFRCLYDFAS